MVKPAGQGAKQSAGAYRALQSGSLIESKHDPKARQTTWVREELAKHEPAHYTLGGRARAAMADLGPRRLHELAELDPGRAGSLASSAIEAERHVANERLGRLDAPLAKRPHQVQAAARRFGLDVQLAKGRAVRHAEPAVDTPTELDRKST